MLFAIVKKKPHICTTCEAELIVERKTKRTVKKVTIKNLKSCKYQVRGTITTGGFGSALGSIFFNLKKRNGKKT